MQPGQSPYYPQLAPPPRSGIPRVIGILAIVFSCMGAAGSLLFTLGPIADLDRHREALGFIMTWVYLWAGISFGLFVLHLVGGVLAVMYRSIGLRLLTGYAVAAIVLIVLDLILLNGFAPDVYRVKKSLVFPRTVFDLMALPWPILVLALVNGRRAKQSCR
jgi:hypothetical protein